MRSPGPVVLGFDTSAAHCAAALLSGGRVAARRHEAMDRGQAERLFPMLEEVLAEGGLGWGELDALGVGTGPGNFTGVRIAVSAARGLALSLGVPAVGVTALEAAAFGLARPVTATLDARRGDVYAQRFDRGAARLVAAEALATELPPGAALVGSGARLVAPLCGAEILEPAVPIAEAVARIAAERFAEAGLPRPAPLYLRAADAALPSEPPPVILP